MIIKANSDLNANPAIRHKNGKGATLTIENIENTETYIIKNLRDLHKVLWLIQGSSNPQFSEWNFLVDWEDYEPMEKLKNYDKYASHELNIFLK